MPNILKSKILKPKNLPMIEKEKRKKLEISGDLVSGWLEGDKGACVWGGGG